MEKQIREFSPSLAAMWEEAAAEDLKRRCADLPVRIVSGMEGLLEIAEQPESEMLLTAVVGMIGIRPTLQAIAAGKDIALANKETLVTAGHLIIPAVREAGVQLLPVDSEHNAIFQCSRGEERKAIRQILLTCSGGPFRGRKKEDLVNVRAADALKHPNWAMGAKITIDSATLVNKGLEVLEAAWLFGVTVDDIHVVVQPQSIVHSAVEYVDGSILAHLASPDMRLPIQYAFFYPERRPLAIKPLDLSALGSIVFEEPDRETFRGLPLAVRAGRTGGSMPTVFNAANEEAVRLFLEDKIRFLDIYDCIEAAMDGHRPVPEPPLDVILEAEQEAREAVRRFCRIS
jgi:1-deoxy-D-xylulose-5-phosphate reductoisomerase